MSKLTDDIRKRFLQCIEETRTANKLMRNNQALAKKIHTQPPRISEWERGKGNPTVEHIFYLCKEFNKSPAFIILGEKIEQEEITSELLNVVRRIEKLEQASGKKRKTG